MTALVVVAKECVPGHVKTRLCPPLSPTGAAAVAAACLADTLAALADAPAARHVLYLGRPDDVGPPGSRRPGPALPDEAVGWEVLGQPTGTLDVRLGALLDHLDEPLLLMGMDTPQVTAAHVAPALDRLAATGSGRDAWLGLAADGGYWALGLGAAAGRSGAASTAARPARRGDLVRGVPMSRDDTGERQRERLERAGLRVHLLDELVDVDTVRDLRGVVREAPGGRVARTAAELGCLEAVPEAVS
ncbi:DUF2064 domain-containing protein [Luteimicrobium sp. NPDC057192]|uniref:TIGR04282 family arsenosugar biosynthesis glycosyltransferase n=1 Tax=Luteimicrobium sp. NPDC057192 TaxID=3346042 RepID=UPI0036396D17